MYPHSSTGLLKKAIPGLLIAVLSLSACGTQGELPREVRSVVGTLCVVGNDPFTDLALQIDAGTMLRVRHDTTAFYRELFKFQGQKLRVQFRSVGPQSDTSFIAVDRYELVKTP